MLISRRSRLHTIKAVFTQMIDHHESNLDLKLKEQ